MKLISNKTRQGEKAAIRTEYGLLPVESIARLENKLWPPDVAGIIRGGKLDEIKSWYEKNKVSVKRFSDCVLIENSLKYEPLLRNPGKIFGIGLNYREHAKDLDETSPEGFPGSFMKPSTTIVGHGDEIHIPVQSHKTTGEAELCIVIGRECRYVKEEKWKEVVAGFTTIIDMTAEDILRLNTRYLTLSKSFDTFLSLGYELVTPDEIENIHELTVETILNGEIRAINQVKNMTFPPGKLLHILSGIMTLQPGDIILTGTPGAAHLNHGDTIEAKISGFMPLVNTVTDLKN